MAATINEYDSYTPTQLSSLLMQIDEGDAQQLHNACIVLCDIAAKQEAIIEQLIKQTVEKMEQTK